MRILVDDFGYLLFDVAVGFRGRGIACNFSAPDFHLTNFDREMPRAHGAVFPNAYSRKNHAEGKGDVMPQSGNLVGKAHLLQLPNKPAPDLQNQRPNVKHYGNDAVSSFRTVIHGDSS